MQALQRHLLGLAMAAPLLACSSEDDGGKGLHHPAKAGSTGGTTVVVDPNGHGASSSGGIGSCHIVGCVMKTHRT